MLQSARQHFEQVRRYAPTIPRADDEPNCPQFDWHELDCNLTVVKGKHSDNEPEFAAADTDRNRIRAHLPNLTPVRLRRYIDGLHGGIGEFYWAGV